jgi:hypothetical protein
MQYTEPVPHGTPGAAHLLDDLQRLDRQRRSQRATFVKWLRKVHGWIGLWGAALGLLVGTTGILLNHRGPPLRIVTGAPQVATLQVPLPQPAPRSPRELAQWLRTELQLDGKLGRVQREPAGAVAWGDRSARQPEHWTMMFNGPSHGAMADYWVGNGFVTVKRTGHGFLATLTNLHKGVGMSIGWVLFMDTIGGSIVLLSLTGVLLWTELNRRRLIGLGLLFGAIAVAVATGLT